MRSLLLIFALLLSACSNKRVAEYHVPDDNVFSNYTVLEVWIESSKPPEGYRLVVKSKGKHVDQEPRIVVEGFNYEKDYRGIAGDSNVLTEYWSITEPFPDSLNLSRGNSSLTVKK